MADRKAVVKNADMTEDMQQDAIDISTQALEKFNIEKDIAALRVHVDAAFFKDCLVSGLALEANQFSLFEENLAWRSGVLGDLGGLIRADRRTGAGIRCTVSYAGAPGVSFIGGCGL